MVYWPKHVWVTNENNSSNFQIEIVYKAVKQNLVFLSITIVFLSTLRSLLNELACLIPKLGVKRASLFNRDLRVGPSDFFLTHISEVWSMNPLYSKKARGLHQLGTSKSKTIDFSLRENNVSVKFLRIHRARMFQWRHFTLDTLINQQDCAVEAVKLERLLMSDIKKKWVLFAFIVNTFVMFHGYSIKQV